MQMLRERDGLGFRDACKRLSIQVSGNPAGAYMIKISSDAGAKSLAWQERSRAFVSRSREALLDDFAREDNPRCPRPFLAERGLTRETIQEAGLGWNPWTKWEDRETWALPRALRNDGKEKKLWLPTGLVIPLYAEEKILRIRIRRSEPGDGPRYVVIPGSDLRPMILGTGPVWVIVESELDALLIKQEAGDLAGVIALGAAQVRPDVDTDRALRAAGLILVALDADEAGARQAWGFWKRAYPTAKRWPVPVGKDPSEAKQAGLNLREWVKAGLSGIVDHRGIPKQPSGPAMETGAF